MTPDALLIHERYKKKLKKPRADHGPPQKLALARQLLAPLLVPNDAELMTFVVRGRRARPLDALVRGVWGYGGAADEGQTGFGGCPEEEVADVDYDC